MIEEYLTGGVILSNGISNGVEKLSGIGGLNVSEDWITLDPIVSKNVEGSGKTWARGFNWADVTYWTCCSGNELSWTEKFETSANSLHGAAVSPAFSGKSAKNIESKYKMLLLIYLIRVMVKAYKKNQSKKICSFNILNLN